MRKIKKILAPTDLSHLSQAGVRYALQLAKDMGAEVTVYHVVSEDEIIRYGEEIKERLAANYAFRPPDSILGSYQMELSRFLNDHFSDLTPWVKIREKVELGRPDKNIVDRARVEASDLIVISTHGRTGLSHMLMGSVTEKVVRSAPCPVLSIHPERKVMTKKEVAAAA